MEFRLTHNYQHVTFVLLKTGPFGGTKSTNRKKASTWEFRDMAKRSVDKSPFEFVGRNTQLAKLNALWRKKRASLVVCVGRRRIGKSRLIQEFGRRHSGQMIEFQGLPPRAGQTNEDQLDHFSEKLAQVMGLDEPIALGSWTQAFALLAQSVSTKKKTVVLLDEISWMGKHDRDFAGKLKEAWDTRFSRCTNLILVLCGSVPAWIEDNILRSTGFVDRPSLRIHLPELPLHDCNQMVWPRNTQISAMEKLRMLAVTGGVPWYLEALDPSQSSVENLQRLCFDPDGPLFRNRDGLSEFEMIFDEVFQGRAAAYRNIVKALSAGSKTLSEISKKLGRTRGGNLSAYLRDLELAGYVREEPHFAIGGTDCKISHYRLSDNYMRFYLKYIEPRRKAIAQGRHRVQALENLPGWDTLLGFQFENLVLNNQRSIEKLLGIEGKVLQGGPFRQTPTKRRKGCQVDLLLETEYNLFFCEIKLRRSIGGRVINEVAEKMKRLSLPRRQKHRNRFPVLIYAGELDPVVETTDFFHSKIDFADMLDSSGTMA
jgi:AAA+ ATPase superfamily predicted ATPase